MKKRWNLVIPYILLASVILFFIFSGEIFTFFNYFSDSEKELKNVNLQDPEITPITNGTPRNDVSGSIFFDKNGNGIWEADESPMENIGICALNLEENWVCTQTNLMGEFIFKEISKEGEQLSVKLEEPKLGQQMFNFKYINLFHGNVTQVAYKYNGDVVEEQILWDSQFIPINSEFNFITVEILEIGLMEGFLTLPYKEKDKGDFEIYSYVDLDERLGEYVRNFRGDTMLSAGFPFEPYINGTGPGHEGIDYLMETGTNVIAAGPGVVLRIGDFTDCSGALSVEILHANGLKTLYSHLSRIYVEKDQKINRGETIGLSGNSGKCSLGPHLHFGLLSTDGLIIDPYRDEIDIDGSPGYWTVDNNPQFLD